MDNTITEIIKRPIAIHGANMEELFQVLSERGIAGILHDGVLIVVQVVSVESVRGD